MTIERLHLAADPGFWPAAARAVRNLAGREGLPAQQLQALTWLVPGGAHAVLARAALRESLANASFIPPRIAPLTEWLGRPLAAGTAARAEIFSALRASAWVRDAFGPQPAMLWALARDIAQLCDELTLAAVDDADAFEGRLQASLARHFRQRAARALQPQAQLVLQLWRARDSSQGRWSTLERAFRLRPTKTGLPAGNTPSCSGARSARRCSSSCRAPQPAFVIGRCLAPPGRK